MLRHAHADSPGTGSPVSAKERSLCLLQQLVPTSGVSNIPVAVRVAGPVRWWPLQEAVHQVVARHPALRTVYRASGDLVQRFESTVDVAVETVPVAQERLADALAAFVAQPFSIEGEPLLRVGLFPARDGDVICAVAHHLVFDGASAQVLVRDLLTAYEHFSSGSPLPQWFLEEPPVPVHPAVTPETVAFWSELLTGTRAEHMKLRFGRGEPATPTLEGDVFHVALSDAVVGAVRSLCRSVKATENAVYLSAFYWLLRRNGAGRDMVVGIPIDVHGARRAGSIGNFANTFALRLQVDESRGFGDLAREARDLLVAVLAHGATPADDFLQHLRGDPAEWRTTPFRHMFNYLPVAQDEALVLDGRPVRTFHQHNGSSRFDFEFLVMPGAERVDIRVTYSREIHDLAQLKALASEYEALLVAAAADSERPLHEVLPVVSRTPAAPAPEEPAQASQETGEVDEELVARLVELWGELLDRSDLTPDSHFFHEGGRSLLAARLVQAAGRMTGVKVKLNRLFAAPTPRGLAAHIAAVRAEAAE